MTSGPWTVDKCATDVKDIDNLIGGSKHAWAPISSMVCQIISGPKTDVVYAPWNEKSWKSSTTYALLNSWFWFSWFSFKFLFQVRSPTPAPTAAEHLQTAPTSVPICRLIRTLRSTSVTAVPRPFPGCLCCLGMKRQAAVQHLQPDVVLGCWAEKWTWAETVWKVKENLWVAQHMCSVDAGTVSWWRSHNFVHVVPTVLQSASPDCVVATSPGELSVWVFCTIKSMPLGFEFLVRNPVPAQPPPPVLEELCATQRSLQIDASLQDPVLFCYWGQTVSPLFPSLLEWRAGEWWIMQTSCLCFQLCVSFCIKIFSSPCPDMSFLSFPFIFFSSVRLA